MHKTHVKRGAKTLCGLSTSAKRRLVIEKASCCVCQRREEFYKHYDAAALEFKDPQWRGECKVNGLPAVLYLERIGDIEARSLVLVLENGIWRHRKDGEVAVPQDDSGG